MTPEQLMKDLETCPYVFVYGTLKKGHGNHRLIADAEPVGAATSTDPTFDMTDVGFPYCYVNGRSFVRGELYHLGMATAILSRLDMLEGYPHHYNRTVFPFITDEGDTFSAWMYNVEKTHRRPGTPIRPDEDNVLIWRP